MAKMSNRRSGPTPSGGDYSEIFCFDEMGNSISAENIGKLTAFAVIRECKGVGTLINEIYFRMDR